MPTRAAESQDADLPRPTCPFCRAPWTDAMLDAFDAMSVPGSCACCADGPTVLHWPLPKPAADLCCEACGRAIYQKA